MAIKKIDATENLIKVFVDFCVRYEYTIPKKVVIVPNNYHLEATETRVFCFQHKYTQNNVKLLYCYTTYWNEVSEHNQYPVFVTSIDNDGCSTLYVVKDWLVLPLPFVSPEDRLIALYKQAVENRCNTEQSNKCNGVALWVAPTSDESTTKTDFKECVNTNDSF